MKNYKPLITSVLIVTACLGTGFWIARHKALWNDEYYSQQNSINGISYADQFLGKIPEGGNAPLFYAVQKLLLQLVHYQVPAPWLQGHWYNDAWSQIILRVNPVVSMSMSVGLVFYYFYRKHSLGIAFISFFIFISSYMLWAYWAEARPYALEVFLTTVQSVVLLNRMDEKPRSDARGLWIMLAATNILLGLTTILSLGEIGAVSVLWWVLNERDWKKYIAITLLPVIIVLFYYAHAPKYQFFFGLSPEQLVRDNIARQRFDVLFIFLIFLSVYFLGQKNRMSKGFFSAEILKPVPYVVFLAGVLAFSGALLWLFSLHASPGRGFPITSRYFIYLTPIGVIATTMLSVSIYKSCDKHRLLQFLMAGLIGFLSVEYLLKTIPKAVHMMKG